MVIFSEERMNESCEYRWMTFYSIKETILYSNPIIFKTYQN